MRKTRLALTKTKVNGRRYYCVTSPKLGAGRNRRFFKDKAEAETFMRLAEVQQENYGTAALSFSDALRVETIECSEWLQPYGKTLRDATKFYLAHLKAVTGSRKVREVVADLLAARVADGMSTRYLGDLRVRLGRFVNCFGEEMIAAINARQIDEWLRGLGVGAVTRNTFRRRLAALFSFAKRRGYVAENPVSDVERAKERETEVEILSVSETARLLEEADSETLPFWAIGAFAGLRRAEIERLAWSEVDFEAGVIEVKASKSKTASRRLVTMQPNLCEWLAPYRAYTGRVCPVNLQQKINDDRERARLRTEWPHNGLRHSFGSYHLARFNDAAKLALEMGNSPGMIFRHYRELVKPKEAERYWKIAPTRVDRKLVAFAAQSA
jgi:Site-specific recombinase XerD